jgi:transcriptional regulator with GAF, ATPase, and Fis domain
MTKEEFTTLISNPVTIVSILASGISIYSVTSQKPEIGFSILILLIVILAGYLSILKIKYDRAKKYREIKSCLHNLAHRARDSFTVLNNTYDSRLAQEHMASSVLNILNTGREIFTKMTGCECVVSLMLENDEGLFQTCFYSSNVSAERESKPNAGLKKDKGIIGLAFDTMDVQLWDDESSNFIPIRDNYKDFYCSGMTIPFHSANEPAGVINIDCMEKNIFSYEYKDLGAMLADTMGCILEMIDMWTIHNGSHISIAKE